MCHCERTSHDTHLDFLFQSFSMLFFHAYNRLERLNNELDVNPKLSINFILYVIFLLFLSSFFIATVKVRHFSAFFC